MAFNNVLLIGAGGNLGSLILKHLMESPSKFTISVLTRHSSSHAFPSSINVIRMDDDYPTSQITDAFQGMDVVISAVSMPAMPLQYKFVEAAVAAKVKRYIPTEFGLDA